MAKASVKQQKIDKLTGQRERLAKRVTKAAAAVVEAQAEETALKAQLAKLDEKITWQKAEPVDEEEDAGQDADDELAPVRE